MVSLRDDIDPFARGDEPADSQLDDKTVDEANPIIDPLGYDERKKGRGLQLAQNNRGAAAPRISGDALAARHADRVRALNEINIARQRKGLQPLTMKDLDDFIAATKAVRRSPTDFVVTPSSVSTEAAALRAAATTPFKNTSLTVSGRALPKHPNVAGFSNGEAMSQALRSPQAINQAADSAVGKILSEGTRTQRTHQRFGEIIDYNLPNGIGARFGAQNRDFITFLGR